MSPEEFEALLAELPGRTQATANLVTGLGATLVPTPVTDVWVGASRVLGRPVLVDDPYPHVHGMTFDGWATEAGREIEVWRNMCGACPQRRPEDW